MAKQNRVYLCMNDGPEQQVFDELESAPSELLTADHPVVVEAAKVCSICVRLGACRADVIRWSKGQDTRQIDISEVPNLVGGQFLTANGTRSFVDVDISGPQSPAPEPEYGPYMIQSKVEVEDTALLDDEATDASEEPAVLADTDNEVAIAPEIESNVEVSKKAERHRQVVIVDSQPVYLTEREVALLRYMMANPDFKVTRGEMMKAQVLGPEASKAVYTNTLSRFMGHASGVVIQVGTKGGGGYVLSGEREIVITDQVIPSHKVPRSAPLAGLVAVDDSAGEQPGAPQEKSELDPGQEAEPGRDLAGPTDDELSLIEIANNYQPPVAPKPASTTKPKSVKPLYESRPKTVSGAKKSGGSTIRETKGSKSDEDADLIKMYLADIGKHPLLTKDDEVRLGKEIEQAIEAKATLDTQGDSLDTAEKRRLLRVVKRGKEAERTFVQSNLRLVVSIAKKYQASGLPLLDLIQEGNLGLMHAVEKFDYRKGFKFSTYGTWWIRQAITRGIANTGRMIRLPVHAGDTLTRIGKARSKLETRLGRQATLREIAEEVNIDPEEIVKFLQYGLDTISLNETLSDDPSSMELGDLIEDRTALRPDEEGIKSLEIDEVARMLGVLDKREQEVLRLRYGLDGGERKNLEEVGEIFNLTRERIRQIEARAMGKLRHPSNSGVAGGFAVGK